MGKKKIKAGSQKPEDLKEFGNKAFGLGKYEEAIDFYTQAIEASAENPNHVYFANRANSKLEQKDFKGCIEDCDSAIKINAEFHKAHFRKAKALQVIGEFQEALQTIQSALKLDPENEDYKEIESQIKQEIEADSVLPKDHVERKKFDALQEWLTKGGAEFSKLRMRFYESTHRGIHAATNLKVGDQILSIPKEQLITKEDVLKTPIGKQMKEAGILEDIENETIEFGVHNIMCVFHLQERQKQREDPKYKSKYEAFLAIQPTDTDDYPACYTDEELELLKGSAIQKKARWMQSEYQKAYDHICGKVPEFSMFTLEEYKTCCILSQSRTYGMLIDGVRTTALVPYADMFNHSNTAETRWSFDSQKRCFVVESNQNTPFGAPVHVSYGQKPTQTLYLMFGFVLHPHDKDDVQITLKIKSAEEDRNHATKVEQLHPSLEGQFFDCTKDLQSNTMEIFLGFARYITHSDPDVSQLHLCRQQHEEKYLQLMKQNGQNPDTMDPIVLQKKIFESFRGLLAASDVANEVAAWQHISKVCLEKLLAYPNTLQEDIKIIEQDDQDHKLTFNVRNCVLYRKGEKEILHYLIDCANKATELSKLSVNDARKQINQWEGHDKRCEGYFKLNFVKLLDS